MGRDFRVVFFNFLNFGFLGGFFIKVFSYKAIYGFVIYVVGCCFEVLGCDCFRLGVRGVGSSFCVS